MNNYWYVKTNRPKVRAGWYIGDPDGDPDTWQGPYTDWDELLKLAFGVVPRHEYQRNRAAKG
jgi:hypothetical protein